MGLKKLQEKVKKHQEKVGEKVCLFSYQKNFLSYITCFYENISLS